MVRARENTLIPNPISTDQSTGEADGANNSPRTPAPPSRLSDTIQPLWLPLRAATAGMVRLTDNPSRDTSPSSSPAVPRLTPASMST